MLNHHVKKTLIQKAIIYYYIQHCSDEIWWYKENGNKRMVIQPFFLIQNIILYICEIGTGCDIGGSDDANDVVKLSVYNIKTKEKASLYLC